jgi:RNA polymerase sigma factor (sigma-70 family)
VARAVAARPAAESAEGTGGEAPGAVDLAKWLSKGATRRLLQRFVRAEASSLSRAAQDDVVQTVSLKILTARSGPDSLEVIDSWAYRIAKNAVIDHGRRAAVHDGRVDREIDVEEAAAAEVNEPEPAPLLPWLDARKLSDADRELVEILKQAGAEELTLKAMAERMGIPQRALSDRVYEFKLRHLRARHQHLERQRAALLLMLALLGIAVVAVVAYLALRPRAAEPARAPVPAPVPVVVPAPVAPEPSFNQALPHTAEPVPEAPPPPVHDAKPRR